MQGKALLGGATTPSATPGQKGLQSLGEDRNRSMQRTMQLSVSNSMQRFTGLVLCLKAVDITVLAPCIQGVKT